MCARSGGSNSGLAPKMHVYSCERRVASYLMSQISLAVHGKQVMHASCMQQAQAHMQCMIFNGLEASLRTNHVHFTSGRRNRGPRSWSYLHACGSCLQGGVTCSGGGQPCTHGAQLGNAVLQGPRRMLAQAASPPKPTEVPSSDGKCLCTSACHAISRDTCLVPAA